MDERQIPKRDLRRLVPLGLIGGLLVASTAIVTSQTKADLFQTPDNLPEVVSKLQSATFEIRCDADWTGAGWGIELDQEHFVVTAQHVIEDCLDGDLLAARNAQKSIFSLEIINSSGGYWIDGGGTTDLALLKASKVITTLKFQTEDAQIGQWVVTAGFPLEEDSGPLINVNQGAITGFDMFSHIVIDASISGGNSGGPVLNSRGEVLGTVYASDPPEEYENLVYVQPIFEHCGIVVQCDEGAPVYSSPPR